MAIYRAVDGVNRKIKSITRAVSGVNKAIKEVYRCVDGANRKVFVSMPEGALWWYNDMCADTTGGYTFNTMYDRTEGIYGSNYLINSDNITLYAGADITIKSYSVTMTSKNTINPTNYTQMNIEYRVSDYSGSDETIALTYGFGDTSSTFQINTDGTRVNKTFPIASGFTTNKFFIKLQNPMRTTVKLVIYRIWLE